MSYWEIFSWITVVFLGIGSITVFLLFIKDIHKLPEQWKYFDGQILLELSQKEKFRVIADYIAGMTDNYLKREYDKFYT